MLSDSTVRTLHEAIRTDRLYVVMRRDGTAWIMEGGDVKEVADEAESIWGVAPWSVTPLEGMLPLPRTEIRP